MSFPLGRLQIESAETPDDVRHTRYRVVVAKPFVWWSDAGPVVEVAVPEGFESDGGSVPRLFWRLLGGPLGPMRDAFIIHDLLYSQAGLGGTRKQADDALKEICLELGAERWRAWAVYRGVRMGGWAAWRKHKKRNGF
jgi:hypothetical protein